jgi:uncharacterized protein (TIGR02598 family)
MAVGIMALGVVTILGLLPHGLEMSRKTANEMAEARIIEHIVGEMQSTQWDALSNYGQQTRYFDDQGLELPNLNTNEARFALNYVIRVEVPQLDVRLPTNSTSTAASEHLRRVTIRMVAAPLPDFNFNSPPPGVPVKSFTQLIANMSPLAKLP